MYGIIYKATNMITGKSYVGLTTKSLSERIYAHVNKANTEKSLFQKSIKKYGVNNFKFEQIDIAFTKEELISKEIFWIKSENTQTPNGYNLTGGGEGMSMISLEVRKKISDSKKGKSNNKLKNRVISKEQRLAISRKLGGSLVVCVNMSNNSFKTYSHVKACIVDGFNPSLVCAVIKGKRNSHKGCKFFYANTELSDILTDDRQCNAYLVNLLSGEYNLGTSVRQP